MLFGVLLIFGFSRKKCFNQPQLRGVGIGASTISSGQFTTSTGGCALIGMNKNDEFEMFYYANFEHLSSDAAKGGGDYLSAFLEIDGCNEGAIIMLKNRFDRYFIQDSEYSYNALKDALRPFCGRG